MRLLIGNHAPPESVRRVFCPGAARRMVFLAHQMIFDVTGSLLADGCQIKQFVLDERVIGPLGNFPIFGRMHA